MPYDVFNISLDQIQKQMNKYSVELIMKLKRSPMIPVMPDAVASVNSKTRKKRTGRSRSTSPQPHEFAINGELYFDSAAVYDQHANVPLSAVGGGNWWEQPQFQQPPQQYLGLQHFTSNLSMRSPSPVSAGSMLSTGGQVSPNSIPDIGPPGFEHNQSTSSDKSQFLHSMMRRRSQTLQALADVNGDLNKLQDKMGQITIGNDDDAYDRLVREANLAASRY